jgi:hypothetical protein
MGIIIKVPMVCPFSKKACKECSYYRGRHYYLCYSREYNKYLATTIHKSNVNSVPLAVANKEHHRE